MHTFEQRNALLHYRRAFAEMPIGDPMSGAAYGEYLKSKAVGAIIGVVAAVAAVYTGGATLGLWGAAAGGSVSVGTALAGGAMIAGGVMSGVGAVTGNTKLTKIGGVLSLAGGLGAMVFGGPTAAVSAAGTEGSAATAVPTDTVGSVTSDTAKAGLAENVAKVSGSDSGALALDGTAQAAEPSRMSQVANAGKTADATVLSQSAPAASSSQGILSQAGDAVGSVSKFANENKGLIEIAGKAFSSSPQGTEGSAELQGAKAALYSAQATTQSSVQAANNAQTDALKQKTDIEAQQRKNANTQILMLDPKDPQYAAKKADATARGIPTMDMVGPAQAGPITAGGMNWSQTSQAPNINIQRAQR